MVPSPSPANNPTCAAFHSQPSDLELVKSYLRPWVSTGLKAGTFIHEADVYAADPADLTREFSPAVAQDGERAWYFLTPLRRKSGRGKRKARVVATGSGWWHNEAKSKPVVDGLGGRREVGYRQSFSFMKKEGGMRTRTGWLMLELRLESEHDDGRGDQEEGSPGSLVLCKVYRSPRQPEPTAGEPAEAPAAPAGRKTEADDDESCEAPPHKGKKAEDDEGSDASAASGRRRKSDGEGSSAATVAAPDRKADGEIPVTATAAAPGRQGEKAAGDEDSAETSAAAPGTKRKAADDESSVAASAAEPERSKRKTDGGSSGAPATEVHCPQCGCHLDVEALLAAAKSKSETKSDNGVVQVEGDSLVKDHSFHKFI
ncbi:hypothetical protein EJB05_17441, partial [Eragrostis curvula]